MSIQCWWNGHQWREINRAWNYWLPRWYVKQFGATAFDDGRAPTETTITRQCQRCGKYDQLTLEGRIGFDSPQRTQAEANATAAFFNSLGIKP